MNIGLTYRHLGSIKSEPPFSLALIEIDRSRFGKVFFFDVLIDRQI